MMKTTFPLDHIIKYDTKEILVKCTSSITAMGLPSLVSKYYPGYTVKIVTEEYLNKWSNQLAN